MQGFRTYPAGSLRAPEGSQNFFSNVKAFRNNNGLFIHLCVNLVIENSLFADNGVSIDLDRTDRVDIINTVIIGETEIFRTQFDTQGRDAQDRNIVDNNCRMFNLVGVEVHTTGRTERFSGHSLDGVTFRGFEDTHCIFGEAGAYPISVDGSVSSSYSEYSKLLFSLPHAY